MFEKKCELCRDISYRYIDKGLYREYKFIRKINDYGTYINPIRNLPKLDKASKEILYHISDNLYQVIPTSKKAPLKLAIALAKLGTYIKRECHYDFSLYDPKSICSCEKDKWATYLFIEEDTVIGAILFYYNFYSNLSNYWCLTWVWIAPEYRRKGLLTKVWPEFLKRVSPFVIQYPLSDSMKSFSEKATNKRDIHLSGDCSIPVFDLQITD